MWFYALPLYDLQANLIINHTANANSLSAIGTISTDLAVGVTTLMWGKNDLSFL